PLQLITAVSTVANDGKLVLPHVAKRVLDKEGEVVHEFDAEPLRQVISKDTAVEMKKILESVVTNGTGGRGKVEGYKVAGKTGTAQKYVPGEYTVSYVGFAPADKPKLAILVVIDNPTHGPIYGSTIAGPAFQKLMEDSLNYLGIQPELTPTETNNEVKVPDLRNLFIEDAKKILSQNGLNYRVEGQGYVVYDQIPVPGAQTKKNSTVLLKVSESTTTKDPVAIPDLMGRTVKETTDILNAIGLDIEIVGSGYVKKQTPPPDVEVGLGTKVKVEFSQKPFIE
ncbi:MAG: PASTA domain-containing protein, partial [Clostridiaceae bacterium]|nr:PASTA domain-containing protein [Clostridiaceae bacterium]